MKKEMKRRQDGVGCYQFATLTERGRHRFRWGIMPHSKKPVTVTTRSLMNNFFSIGDPSLTWTSRWCFWSIPKDSMNFKYCVGIALDFSALSRTHSVDPLLRDTSTHPMEVRCIITPLSSLLVEVAKSGVTMISHPISRVDNTNIAISTYKQKVQ